MGALSVTWKEKFRKPFEPLISPVEFCKFNDINDLEKKVDKETAAIIVEPIQGESGVYEVSNGFIEVIFEKREELGFLVLFDEVQTGFGRTGKWFAKDHFGVQPDIITMAKAMASGIPIGGIGVKDDIAERIELSEHGSTFGGNPLACSASLATIEILEKENLVENAEKVGYYLKKRLEELGFNPRGKGLMLGFDLEGEYKNKAVEIVKKSLEKGLILNYTSENTIRLVPPLILKKEEVDYAFEILKSIFS
jgi:acetylornithine/N-succinyldiaminopimelate aminotransferase